jgi:hypothetical protein
MKVFKTRFFNKWQNKESELDDKSLISAIEELEKGLFEANLGWNLYTKRVARPGKGKRGSYRVIIAHKSRDSSWIFVYGFSKSELSNVNDDDLEELKELANDLFSISIDKLASVLIEVKNEK